VATQHGLQKPGPNVQVYIENTGDTDLIFLEMFKRSFYQDISLSEWLAHTPPELVMAHLRIDQATFDAIHKEEFVVLPG